jgi:TonB family protein
MRFRLTVLLLAVAVVGLVAQSAPPRIEPKDAKKFVGKVATVCGRIGSTGCKAGVTAFYFSGTSSGHVSITLPQPARPAADPRVEDRYIAQGVCVTGMVTKGSGAGETAIDDLARITVEQSVPVPSFGAQAHYPCEPGAQQAVVTRQIPPAYPRDVGFKRVRGIVLLQAVIEADGRMGDMRLLQSLDPAWDQAAAGTFRQWQFKPGTFNGQPAAMIFTAEFHYD